MTNPIYSKMLTTTEINDYKIEEHFLENAAKNHNCTPIFLTMLKILCKRYLKAIDEQNINQLENTICKIKKLVSISNRKEIK